MNTAINSATPNASRFFCEVCRRESHFVPIHRAITIAGVSRSTMYYWIDKSWVHWVMLPSKRKVICEESLQRKQSSGLRFLAKGAAA